MVLATMSGYLLPVRPVEGSADHRAGDVVELGLDGLGDRRALQIGPRKGVVDLVRRLLWRSIQQLAGKDTCP